MEDNIDKTVVLTDDEGNEYKFEILGFTEYLEKTYAVFMPEGQEINDDEEQEVALIVMETEFVKDEPFFTLCEDEEIGNAVLDKFMEEQEEEES